jgi:hypothetical protein
MGRPGANEEETMRKTIDDVANTVLSIALGVAGVAFVVYAVAQGLF